MITDTPFFAMEKIHNKIHGKKERMMLDNKRSSQKIVHKGSDDFTTAIKSINKLDQNKLKQLKNRYSSNIIFTNPENTPIEKNRN